MLPDMSDVLDEWAEPVVVKTVTVTSVDFVETTAVTGRTIDAVVQPATSEQLKPLQVDYSLRYLQVHSAAPLAVGEYIEDGGEDYKIISSTDYQRYGYTEAIAEQTKRPRLVVSG